MKKKTCIGRCEIFSARSFLPNEFYAQEEKQIGQRSVQLSELDREKNQAVKAQLVFCYFYFEKKIPGSFYSGKMQRSKIFLRPSIWRMKNES